MRIRSHEQSGPGGAQEGERGIGGALAGGAAGMLGCSWRLATDGPAWRQLMGMLTVLQLP